MLATIGTGNLTRWVAYETLEPLGEGKMVRDALVVHLNWAAKTTR